MSYGPMKVFSHSGLSIASGASTSSNFYLDKGYSYVYAEVSSMSTAAALDVWGSLDGTTFRPVLQQVNTATVQCQAMAVASAVGANGGFGPVGQVITPYIQFRASAVVSGGVTIKLICTD